MFRPCLMRTVRDGLAAGELPIVHMHADAVYCVFPRNACALPVASPLQCTSCRQHALLVRSGFVVAGCDAACLCRASAAAHSLEGDGLKWFLVLRHGRACPRKSWSTRLAHHKIVGCATAPIDAPTATRFCTPYETAFMTQ